MCITWGMYIVYCGHNFGLNSLDGANTPNMTHLHDFHHLLLLDTAILVNVIETECHSQLVLRFAWSCDVYCLFAIKALICTSYIIIKTILPLATWKCYKWKKAFKPTRLPTLLSLEQCTNKRGLTLKVYLPFLSTLAAQSFFVEVSPCLLPTDCRFIARIPTTTATKGDLYSWTAEAMMIIICGTRLIT